MVSGLGILVSDNILANHKLCSPIPPPPCPGFVFSRISWVCGQKDVFEADIPVLSLISALV